MSRPHYTVLAISTGQTVYSGQSESMAAAALNPGYVYGKGATKVESQAMAKRNREAQLCKCLEKCCA